MYADPRIYSASLAATALGGVGAAYMRCVVVKAEVMVYDRVIGVVGFDQVLESSRSLFGSCLDVVHCDRR